MGLPGRLERAELRGAGPDVLRHFGGVRDDGLLGQHTSQGSPATGADRLARRAHTIPTPFAEQVFDDAVLTRMVGDNAQAAPRNQRVAEFRQRGAELPQLIVYRDAQRLEQPREILRLGTGPELGPDRVD